MKRTVLIIALLAIASACFATPAAKKVVGKPGTAALNMDVFTLGEHKYLLLPMRYNFDQASKLCEEMGGHILSIDSEQELKHFQKAAALARDNLLLDLSDARKEDWWQHWDGMPPMFTHWHEGEPNSGDGDEDAVLLSGTHGYMYDVSRTTGFGSVFCEWEPGAEIDLSKLKLEALAEVSIKTSRTSVGALKPGAQRLSGGFSAPFGTIGRDIRGAQYTRVPWKSRFTHTITVTKAGYVYLYKTNEWKDKGKSEWTPVPDAVLGSWHKSGAIRKWCRKGETIAFRNYEPGVAAAKISLN